MILSSFIALCVPSTGTKRIDRLPWFNLPFGIKSLFSVQRWSATAACAAPDFNRPRHRHSRSCANSVSTIETSIVVSASFSDEASWSVWVSGAGGVWIWTFVLLDVWSGAPSNAVLNGCGGWAAVVSSCAAAVSIAVSVWFSFSVSVSASIVTGHSPSRVPSSVSIRLRLLAVVSRVPLLYPI